MSLNVKVLFGNHDSVSAPAFSSRIKVLRMAGYSPGYPVNISENGDFNLIGCESYPVQSLKNVMLHRKLKCDGPG